MFEYILSAALLLNAGCAAFHADSSHEAFSFTTNEEAFAQALAHFSQGLIYETDHGRISDEALHEFEQAAELDPQTHLLSSKAAATAIRRGDTDTAIRILTESCRHSPHSLQARLDLAAAYHIIQDYDKAIREYERARRIDPGEPVTYVALAALYFQTENPRKAVRILRRGAAHADDPAPILEFCLSQGAHLAKIQQLEAAIGCFKILAEHSDNAKGYFLTVLGDLSDGLNDVAAAERYYRVGTKATPPFPNAYVKLALLQARTDPARAVRTLQGARQIFPDHALILFALSNLYADLGNYDEALSIMDRIRENTENSVKEQPSQAFYLHYGMVADRAGYVDKAEAMFEECIKLYPDSHRALNYLAYTWADAGRNIDKALTYAERAVEQRPDNGAYLDTLGWVYFRKGDYEKALTYIRQADEAYPGDPTITDHLGDAYKALDQEKKAVAYWKESYRLDPENESVKNKLIESGADAQNTMGEPPDEGAAKDHAVRVREP